MMLFGGVSPIYILLDELLCSEECRLREFFVILAYLYLFTVFKDFLETVIVTGKFCQFLAEVLLYLSRDLVGTLADDSDALVDIVGVAA